MTGSGMVMGDVILWIIAVAVTIAILVAIFWGLFIFIVDPIQWWWWDRQLRRSNMKRWRQ